MLITELSTKYLRRMLAATKKAIGPDAVEEGEIENGES